MDDINKNLGCKSDSELPEKANEECHSPPEQQGSAVADLLHVLGIKKKKVNLLGNSQQSSDVFRDEIHLEEKPQDTELSMLQDDVNKEELYVLEQNHIPPSQNKKYRTVRFIAFCTAAAIALGGWRFLPLLLELRPPAADVVGSYNGKNITIGDLEAFIMTEGVKEREHMLCPVHGYDHSICDPSEECESHPVDSLQGYQQMVGRLAIEQIITEWAQTQGITNREDVQHGMKDLLNDVTIEQYASQLHEENVSPESISKWEVQQYYSENQGSFGGQSLADVESQIRNTLATQKDEDFFPTFIEELKKTAGLQVDFEVLRVTVPTAQEIEAYYNANIEQYRTEKTATYNEILIAAGNADTATNAIRKIRSGESFESVATSFSQRGIAKSQSITKGNGEPSIENIIWKMKAGDVSDPVTNKDGTISIIKLTEITEAGSQMLASVSKDIESELLIENTEKEYNKRKNDTLFSIHSRRYTLGEFYTEFKELSPAYQAQLSTFAAKKQLLEQMISRELLLEKSGDASSASRESHQLEELQIQYLSQILHEEEVDANLAEPTEEEVRNFYDKNKEKLVNPATVGLNLIWVDQGQKGEKKEQAIAKAKEALSLLQGGTSFAEVAQKYSEDTSAANGGQIQGELREEYLAPDIAKAAFSMSIGDVSDVIDSAYGYYIIQIRSRTEPNIPGFEDVAERIKSHLQEAAHQEQTEKMQAKMLEKSDFIIYNRTLRKLL